MVDGYECNYCGSVFTKETNLLAHKKTAKYCLLIQGKTVNSKTFKCKDCESFFNHAANLTRHRKTCKSVEINALKLEINQYKSDVTGLEKKIVELENENSRLNLLLAENKGQIKVYKERPGSVTQYVNPKILNVKCDTIPPLTIENVKKEIDEGSYTYDMYIRGERGLVDFVAGMIKSDDDQRSYVCTDVARNKFHRLIETREWENDNGATFLNKIFDQLQGSAKEYYQKINNMTLIPEEQDTGDFLMNKTKRMFFGITCPKSKDRTELWVKIRNDVRKLASI